MHVASNYNKVQTKKTVLEQWIEISWFETKPWQRKQTEHKKKKHKWTHKLKTWATQTQLKTWSALCFYKKTFPKFFILVQKKSVTTKL